MLEYLRIRNLALIEDMALEFSAGINVLTGETGAGKSFIIKALTFLLGEKLDVSMVRNGAERAQIEALFVQGQQEIVIKRELAAQTGRSRLYINDSLHSQEQLKILREQLIAYTSQHSQQQLLQPIYQEILFENLIDDKDLLNKRDVFLGQLRQLLSERKSLEEKYSKLADNRTFLEMQQEEINKVHPCPEEDEKLEEMRQMARSAKSQRETYDAALQVLYGDDGPGLLDQLGSFRKILHAMDSDDASIVAAHDATVALEQQLSNLKRSFKEPNFENNIDLDAVEERLFTLAQLKRKLHKTLPEILNLKEEIAENLSFLDSCSLDLSHMRQKEAQLRSQLETILQKIAPLRREKAASFAKQLEQQLAELGFAKEVKVIPNFITTAIWEDILDERVRLLWAPNPGQAPQPLDKIASGGELSRFLLAMACIKKDNEDITFIFDEVDAGVGGLTLNKISQKIKELAKKHQVLLITHWPQLAFCADRHFQVQKNICEGATTTRCMQLDEAGRHAELARMGGGGAQGEALAKSLA